MQMQLRVETINDRANASRGENIDAAFAAL